MYFKPLRLLLQEASKAELEATNPLDKIYALLNLATDLDNLGIEVYYTVSATRLYAKVARTIYNQGDLALLAYCGDIAPGLPSWIPNFSGERGYIPIREHCEYAQTGTSAFDASLGKDAIVAPEGDNPRVLRLHGVMVDTITYVDVMRAKVGRDEVTPNIKKHMIQWLRRACGTFDSVECEAYPTAEVRKEAAWKTLILDHFRFGRRPMRADLEAEKGYNALLNDQEDISEPEVARLADMYFSQMLDITNGTKPFRTSKGYFRLGRWNVVEGDDIVVFLGCEVPLVLRKEQSGYKLIGKASVHGIMYGKFFTHAQHLTSLDLC